MGRVVRPRDRIIGSGYVEVADHLSQRFVWHLYAPAHDARPLPLSAASRRTSRSEPLELAAIRPAPPIATGSPAQTATIAMPGARPVAATQISTASTGTMAPVASPNPTAKRTVALMPTHHPAG